MGLSLPINYKELLELINETLADNNLTLEELTNIDIIIKNIMENPPYIYSYSNEDDVESYEDIIKLQPTIKRYLKNKAFW